MLLINNRYLMWEFYCRVSSTQIELTYCGRLVSVPSFHVFPPMNFKSFSCALLFYVALTRAHGDHSHEPDSGDAAQYAQRHVRVHITHLSRFKWYHC